MSKPLLAMTLIATLALTGCGKDASDLIPPGIYSGSTSLDRAVTLNYGVNVVEVNRREKSAVLVKPDINNEFVAKFEAGSPTWKCKVAAKGEEIQCTVKYSDRSEVIDLMRE